MLVNQCTTNLNLNWIVSLLIKLPKYTTTTTWTELHAAVPFVRVEYLFYLNSGVKQNANCFAWYCRAVLETRAVAAIKWDFHICKFKFFLSIWWHQWKRIITDIINNIYLIAISSIPHVLQPCCLQSTSCVCLRCTASCLWWWRWPAPLRSTSLCSPPTSSASSVASSSSNTWWAHHGV